MAVSIMAVGLGGSTVIMGDYGFMSLWLGWFWNGLWWVHGGWSFEGFFFFLCALSFMGFLSYGGSGWSGWSLWGFFFFPPESCFFSCLWLKFYEGFFFFFPPMVVLMVAGSGWSLWVFYSSSKLLFFFFGLFSGSGWQWIVDSCFMFFLTDGGGWWIWAAEKREMVKKN